MIMPLKRFWRVKIYVPIAHALGDESLDGIADDTSSSVRVILDAIWRVPGVGDVGSYTALYELDFGFESYRAIEGATPKYGAIGETVRVGKAAVVTYVIRDCDPQILDRLTAEIVKVHPWEHPVIEFTECLLYLPVRRDMNERDPDI
jgi:hypothetical protein